MAPAATLPNKAALRPLTVLMFIVTPEVAAVLAPDTGSHPGPPRDLALSRDLMPLFLSLFPHAGGSLAGFGDMAHPRLRLADLDIFDAA